MTLATVRTAWKEKIFDNTTIKAITTNAYDYDIIEDSQSDVRKYYYNNDINFFVYNVTKKTTIKLMGATEDTYQVEVKYYKEHDKAGTNQNEIKDTFETIQTKVASELTTNWNSTVDFYQFQDNVITLETIQLDGKSCWLGKIVYEAIKTICN